MRVIVKGMTQDREIRVYDDVIKVTLTAHYCTINYFDQDVQMQQEILNLLLVNVKII